LIREVGIWQLDLFIRVILAFGKHDRFRFDVGEASRGIAPDEGSMARTHSLMLAQISSDLRSVHAARVH
jgi:hypothetical protein